MKGMGAVAICSVLAIAAAGLHAGVISDASFFNSLSYTRLQFETYADGSPVVLGSGQTMTFYYDEYEPNYGVLFDYEPYGYMQDISFSNDSDPNFDSAQSIGGSLQIAIPGPSEDSFAVVFDPSSVRSVGFWVVNNSNFSTKPQFVAKNSSGTVLETVTFEGSLIDGSIANAQYGFMGIYYADDYITRLEITKDSTLLDNLTFSPEVPEPVSLTLLAAGGLAALLRRRR
jgi:hypothetical protein